MEKKIISELPNEIFNKRKNGLLNKYDSCIAIPYGKKCLVWIREIEEIEYCFICELNSDKKVVKINKKLLSFNSELVNKKGTILYCTIDNNKSYNNKLKIIVEDIYYYKGRNVLESNFKNKLYIYKSLFEEDINNSIYNDIYISLVEIKHTYDELISNLLNIPYDIYSVKYVEMRSNKIRTIISKNIPELNKIKLNFIVYKQMKCEYYELYVLDDNKEILYDKLYIKTLAHSKLLDTIFNNKDTSKVIMECFYDKKKGWIPNKIVNKRVANLNDIKRF
jgi:hypothetical protein